LDAHGQRPKMPDAVDFRMRPASRAKGPVCHGMDPMGPSWVHGVGLAWNMANSPCLRMSVRFCYDIFYFSSPSFSHIWVVFQFMANFTTNNHFEAIWLNNVRYILYPFDLNTVV
jgi:hypothetical protein